MYNEPTLGRTLVRAAAVGLVAAFVGRSINLLLSPKL